VQKEINIDEIFLHRSSSAQVCFQVTAINLFISN